MELSEIKRIPHSVEAEQSVIGSVLIDPSCMSLLADRLSGECFYVEKYAQIYEILLDMFLSNRTIDFVTVLEAVKSQGIFDETDGKRVLYDMTQMVPSTRNVEEYAKIIVEKYRLRRLIAACDDITAACYEQSMDASQILEMAETRIYEIMQSRSHTSMTHIKKAIAESFTNLQKLANDKSAFIGLQTHYREIDQMLSGLGKGDLILIAARPGIGKTSFALNIAQNIGLDTPRKTVAVFSMEMPNEQLTNRMLSAQSGINNLKFRSGEFETEDWVNLAKASAILSKTEIYFDDTSYSVTEIKAKLRRMKKLDLIIIDYLQLMSGKGLSSSGRFDNRAVEVGAISRALKIMAKEFSVPVIALSQLNRETEKTKSKPQLSNLRESGAIEQDADAILFLWRPEENEDNAASVSVVKCEVAKNRHGPIGSIDLAWTPDVTRFTNIAKM